jgi:hypothetical protein
MTLLDVFGDDFSGGRQNATGIGVLFTARGMARRSEPIVARRWAGETRRQMQVSIGIAFYWWSVLHRVRRFSSSLGRLTFPSGGARGWKYSVVFSTVLLQREVEDRFRGASSRLNWRWRH